MLLKNKGMLNQAYRKHHKHWFDYNQHVETDEKYLSYFDTPTVKEKIVKNPKIVQRVKSAKSRLKPSENDDPYQNIFNKPKQTEGSLKLAKSVKKFKATEESIPEDLLLKAKLVNASRIYYEEGESAAQTYLDSQGLNYTIEKELSSGISLVLLDNETGKATIAYRGTDVSNSKDLITDALALFGQERSSPEYGESKGQLEAVEELYGKPQELVGFSRGSVLSMNLGDEYSIPTTQFNPLISPSLVRSQAEGSTHTILRTLNDPVSILAKGTVAGSRWTIKSVLPLQDTLNPIEEHYLKQFLTNDTPRRTSIEELLNTRIQTQGARVSEYTMMNEMLNYVEKGANFSFYMQKVNPADAVIGESQRVYEGSNYTELWKDLGGTFSPEEAHAISQNQVGSSRPFETTPEERSSYTRLDQQTRQGIIDQSMENMKNTLETSARFSQEPNAVREELVRQTTLGGTSPEMSSMLVDALHPVSQIKGLAGGIAGFEEAKLIDTLSGGALGAVGTTTLGGALGAVNTSLASAALAGSAEALTLGALLPEIVAGGSGAIAGYETQQAVAQALKDAGANEDTIQSVSSITGGAVGGATTAAVGIGASVGLAALTGGEIGLSLAPETLGASVAIGAALGAVVGAGGYVAGKIGSAASTLVGEIQNPTVNPYYVGPAPMFASTQETMQYLQRQSAMQQQQQQDQSQGISVEQRIAMNNAP